MFYVLQNSGRTANGIINIYQFKLVILAEIVVNMEVHIFMYDNNCKLKSKLPLRINNETYF